MKQSASPASELISLEAVTVGSLAGELMMVDIVKFLKLSSFKNEAGINFIKYWDQQKMFVSSSLSGDLIFNGFGGKSQYIPMKIFRDEPIYDFKILDEFNLLVCGEEPGVFQVDIRKGVIN